jgi:hypothetical protein
LREFPGKALLQLRLVVDKGDRDIGAERRDGFQRLKIAPGRDDFFGAKMFGDLNREAPGGAGRSVHQDGLSGLEPRALRKRCPRRHAGIGDRSRRHIVELIGQSVTVRRRDHCAFGHAAIGRARHDEIHAGPVIEPAYAIDARDKGKLAR